MVDREVKVRLTADASGLRKGFTDAGTAAKGLNREIDGGTEKSTRAARDRFAKLAKAAAAAFAGVQIGKFLADTVRAASDLEQSVGAVEAVFKGAAGQIKMFGKTAATELGLSEAAYSQMAATFGSQLKNMGVAQDELAPKTNELIGLGADLAAQFGGSTSDAVAALSSLLRGERDPIERYGVSINEAKIKAEMAASGLGKLTGKAADNAKLTATLKLLYEQTADAQGAFGRESETLAGKQQRLQASMEDVKARIGQGLLPAVTGLIDLFAKYGLPIIEGFGKALGFLVKLFTDAPGPIKAFTVALVAIGLARHFGVFRGFRDLLGGLREGFQQARASGVGFGSAMGSLARQIGPGLGFAGFAAVVTVALGKLQESNRIIDSVRDSYLSLSDALVANGGAWDENTRKQLQNNIVNSDGFKRLAERTGDYKLTLDALTGSKEAQNKILSDSRFVFGSWGIEARAMFDIASAGKTEVEGVSAALREANEEASRPTSWDNLVSGLEKVTASAAKVKEEASSERGAIRTIRDLSRLAMSAAEWARPWQDWSDTVAESADALSHALNTLTPFERQARSTADQQKRLADQTDRVRIALDRLNGVDIDAEQAMSDLNGWVADLGDTFKDADGKLADLNGTFDDSTGQIKTNTEAGRKLFGELATGRQRMDDAYSSQLKLTGSTKAARAAVDEQYQSLRATLGQMGLTSAQIDVLLGRYGLIPRDIATVTSMDNRQALAKAKEVLTAVLGLTGTLWSMPVDANTGGASGKLDELRRNVGQGATMPIGANTNPVIEAVKEAQRFISSTWATIGVGGRFLGGGLVSGFASGGRIPGTPPNRLIDDRWGVVDGRAPIRVQSGEYITNSAATARNIKTLNAINFHGFDADKVLGFAAGGLASGRESSTPASIDYSRMSGMTAVVSVDGQLFEGRITAVAERVVQQGISRQADSVGRWRAV